MFNAFVITFSILPVLLVVFLPIANRIRTGKAVDIFEPPWMVASCLLIGTTIRSITLIYDPDAERKMFQVLGHLTREEALPVGLMAINLGTLAWWLGYHSRPKVRLFLRPISAPAISQQKLFLGLTIILTIGLALTALYLRQINFFSSLSSFGLSAKRLFIVGDVAGNTTSFGYLRIGADFVAVAAIIYFADFMRRHSFSARRKVFQLCLFGLAVLVPFVASARGEILFLFFSLLLVMHYARKRVSMTQVVAFTVIAFLLLGVMGELRRQAYSRINHGFSDSQFVLADAFHTLAYNAHFIGVGKTAVVVTQIPERASFMYGSSYLSFLIAPIPRTLWPDKPVVRIGRFVGVELYQRESFSGVPPGLYGEAYLNFGWLGIAIIPYLFGYWCRAAYRRFVLERSPKDFLGIALYGILWVFMMNMMMTDFTGSLVKLVRYLIPFGIVWWLACTPTRKAQRAPSQDGPQPAE